MASAKAVWGIDLGRCALKAVKLRSGAEGKVEIVAHDFIEHGKILSQPDADRQELISNALEKFLSRNDISKDLVFVGVPGQHTLARFSKLPPVAPKRIPDIVRYEADQQIPFDMDEVIWDYQTFQEEGAPDIEVGIFAMKRELIREHLLHFEQASIEPVGVQCGPLAVYNAVQYDDLLSKETTVILDIGAEGTDLIIGTPSRLWTRAIPIGGNSFSDALVKSFKLSFSKAENLKRNAAASKYARQTFQTMRPVFADLVQELQRSLGFYSSTHREAKVEKLIGVGDAFLLPGLQKYLQQNLGIPVVLPETFQKATPAEGFQTAGWKEHQLGYWVAYGLALQGLELTKVSSNLLPTEIAKQIVWRKKRPAFAAAAACLVLTGAIIWFRYSADMRVLAAAAEGSEEVEITSDEQAAVVIDNGPNPSLPDRAKSQMVIAAGDRLTTALAKLSGAGEKEANEAAMLVKIRRQQTVVPQIVQIIHEALPTPQGALAGASTPEEAAAAAATVPRGERRQVLIQGVSMEYVADVNDPIWPKSLIDVEPPLHDVEKRNPGFAIKITCTTPNQRGIDFLKAEFLNPLRDKGRAAGRGFHFDRVHLIKGEKIEAAEPSRTAPGRGSAPGRGGAAGPAGAEATGEGLLDPLTNEATVGDWRFEVWVDAHLGDVDDEGEPEDRSRAKGGAKDESDED